MDSDIICILESFLYFYLCTEKAFSLLANVIFSPSSYISSINFFALFDENSYITVENRVKTKKQTLHKNVME